MPVSGLVVTLSADRARRSRALDALGRNPLLSLGEPAGSRLPLVAETRSHAEHQALWRELESLDGVLLVQLAYHDFSDLSVRAAAEGSPISEGERTARRTSAGAGPVRGFEPASAGGSATRGPARGPGEPVVSELAGEGPAGEPDGGDSGAT